MTELIAERRRRVAKRVWIVAGLVVGVLGLVSQAQVFRSAVDMVSLGVTVMDREGHFVIDLAPEDFDITEDGVAQTVRLFLRGDTEPAPELHLGLLFDSSGSMVDDIELSRSAAIKFLNRLPEAADGTLVGFGNRA